MKPETPSSSRSPHSYHATRRGAHKYQTTNRPRIAEIPVRQNCISVITGMSPWLKLDKNRPLNDEGPEIRDIARKLASPNGADGSHRTRPCSRESLWKTLGFCIDIYRFLPV